MYDMPEKEHDRLVTLIDRCETRISNLKTRVNEMETGMLAKQIFDAFKEGLNW